MILFIGKSNLPPEPFAGIKTLFLGRGMCGGSFQIQPLKAMFGTNASQNQRACSHPANPYPKDSPQSNPIFYPDG
jgi:hypothetical protein